MVRELVAEQRQTAVLGRDSLFMALSVGAFVGFFGWALTIAINSWVLNPIFCRSADTASVCASAGTTAWVVAHILMSIVGLFVLIRMNIFRPLLVVLAALVTLWTVGLWFLPVGWWIGLVWEGLLFALAYALYTWLASGKNFVLALIAIVALVIGFRIIIAQ